MFVHRDDSTNGKPIKLTQFTRTFFIGFKTHEKCTHNVDGAALNFMAALHRYTIALLGLETKMPEQLEDCALSKIPGSQPLRRSKLHEMI